MSDEQVDGIIRQLNMIADAFAKVEEERDAASAEVAKLRRILDATREQLVKAKMERDAAASRTSTRKRKRRPVFRSWTCGSFTWRIGFPDGWFTLLDYANHIGDCSGALAIPYMAAAVEFDKVEVDNSGDVQLFRAREQSAPPKHPEFPEGWFTVDDYVKHCADIYSTVVHPDDAMMELHAESRGDGVLACRINRDMSFSYMVRK